MRLSKLAGLALAALTLGGTAAQASPPDVAYDEMKACALLGAKPPGSAAGRAQAQRIEKAFNAAGLKTTREAFHVPRFEVERVSLTATGAAVEAETFHYGGTGRVKAPLVDVGVGRPADYAGKHVTGKVVMVSRDEVFHRSSQLREVIAHGGAAMLFVSGSPDNLIQDGTVRFAQSEPASIPAISVGAADGAALRAQPGVTVDLEVRATREDAVAHNVIGVREGTTHPDKVIVVGAHYDSWHGGAIDNCTAVGSLLSIVKDVKKTPLAYTVVFAGWDAEEIGLTGSYDWVARHRDELSEVVVNENLEMTAAEAGAPAIRFGTSGATMKALVKQAAAANGYAVVQELPAAIARAISGGILPTDIQPFYTAGVQGFSTFTSTPFYHTPQDTPERVDAASLRKVSAYLRDALLAFQTADPASLAEREVPRVKVSAPAKADAGEAFMVDIEVTSPTGAPLAGVPVRVLANQNDHWAVEEGMATDLGGGRYRYKIGAGATDADRTEITATADTPAFMAEGYATVDQRRGGLLVRDPKPCSNARFFVEPTRSRVAEAGVSAGEVDVLADGRLLKVDLREAGRDVVTLHLGSLHGSQTRQYRACAA